MIDTGDKRPIGYWLKKLDRLIDGQFERQLGDAGLSRRQWQVLNLLQDGPRSMPELHAELEPFLQEAPDELGDAVAGLLSRGWADSQDAVISLTETGEAHSAWSRPRSPSFVKVWLPEYRQRSTEQRSKSWFGWLQISSQMPDRVSGCAKPIRNREARVTEPQLA